MHPAKVRALIKTQMEDLRDHMLAFHYLTSCFEPLAWDQENAQQLQAVHDKYHASTPPTGNFNTVVEQHEVTDLGTTSIVVPGIEAQ